MDRRRFDADPERYHRSRPRYPDALFDDLAVYAGLEEDARVAEIGCGTGPATRPMAERGWDVLAVELGSALAAYAARELAAYPNVEVRNADFDRLDLAAGAFDTVVAFTSFHWLDPATRSERAARLLRPGGVLATVGTHQVRDGDAGFAAASQLCCLRWDPDTAPGFVQSLAADIEPYPSDLDASPLFGEATAKRYQATVTYTAAGYADLVGTWSPVLAMPPESRQSLLDCLAGLIDGRFGGEIAKTKVFELTMARKA